MGWGVSLSLGSSGYSGGLHGHGRGGLVVGFGGHLQPPGPVRHQADRVASEHRQVLGVQEERRGHQVVPAAGRVGEQQVAAVQRGDGDGAAGGQSCGGGRIYYWGMGENCFMSHNMQQE